MTTIDRHVDNRPSLDGVADFLASRRISLPRGAQEDTFEETICGLGNRMHDVFLDLLDEAMPALESTVDLLRELQEAGLATGDLHAGSQLASHAARRGHRESVRRSRRRCDSPGGSRATAGPNPPCCSK